MILVESEGSEVMMIRSENQQQVGNVWQTRTSEAVVDTSDMNLCAQDPRLPVAVPVANRT